MTLHEHVAFDGEGFFGGTGNDFRKLIFDIE